MTAATGSLSSPPAPAPITNRQPPAEPLPEPGSYFLQRARGGMLPLLRHAVDNDGGPVRILDSHQAAADILRAFGGDPGFLDTNPDALGPHPNTP